MMTSQPSASQPAKYSQKFALSVRIFHWIGAGLILAAFISINQGDEFIGVHKSIGASFLLWTILRIINRFFHQVPAYLPMPKWQTGAMHLTHLGLYLAMLAMPISGMLMSMYGGRGVSVFGLFNIAPFVPPNRELSGVFHGLHTEIILPVMILLIAAHIGAALYHQFVVKDNLLVRMR